MDAHLTSRVPSPPSSIPVVQFRQFRHHIPDSALLIIALLLASLILLLVLNVYLLTPACCRKPIPSLPYRWRPISNACRPTTLSNEHRHIWCLECSNLKQVTIDCTGSMKPALDAKPMHTSLVVADPPTQSTSLFKQPPLSVPTSIVTPRRVWILITHSHSILH